MTDPQTEKIQELEKYIAEDPACALALGVPSRIEHRWPASLAVLFAITIYFGLPAKYVVGPNWLVPALELAILLPLTITAPHRVSNESKTHQFLAVALIAIVMIANLGSLVLLVSRLLFEPRSVIGTELFFSAFEIWVTNVIVFALWYWEVDRGGPDERTHERHQAPDFLFPQMNTPGCAKADWTPSFLDYLYLAYTNSTAFSPTDVMPLTAIAKALMFCQSTISLITISLVAARAVNILG